MPYCLYPSPDLCYHFSNSYFNVLSLSFSLLPHSNLPHIPNLKHLIVPLTTRQVPSLVQKGKPQIIGIQKAVVIPILLQ